MRICAHVYMRVEVCVQSIMCAYVSMSGTLANLLATCLSCEMFKYIPSQRRSARQSSTAVCAWQLKKAMPYTHTYIYMYIL